MISDARALEAVEDRLSYAQILLDMVQHVRQGAGRPAHGRSATLRIRVERILDGSATVAKAGWRKRLQNCCCDHAGGHRLRPHHRLEHAVTIHADDKRRSRSDNDGCTLRSRSITTTSAPGS